MKNMFQKFMARRTTPRLFLSVITQDDLDDVFQSMNNAETAAMVSFLSWPVTMNQAQAWVNKAIAGWESGEEFIYIARRKDNGAVAGCAGAHRHEQSAEIGYWVAPTERGQDFAAEMAQAAADVARTVFRPEKIFATCTPENSGSVRVLEKSGFICKGEKPVALPGGGVRRSLLFERT